MVNTIILAGTDDGTGLMCLLLFYAFVQIIYFYHALGIGKEDVDAREYDENNKRDEIKEKIRVQELTEEKKEEMREEEKQRQVEWEKKLDKELEEMYRYWKS